MSPDFCHLFSCSCAAGCFSESSVFTKQSLTTPQPVACFMFQDSLRFAVYQFAISGLAGPLLSDSLIGPCLSDLSFRSSLTTDGCSIFSFFFIPCLLDGFFSSIFFHFGVHAYLKKLTDSCLPGTFLDGEGRVSELKECLLS